MAKCTEKVSANGVMALCTLAPGKTAQSMAKVYSSMAMDPNMRDLLKMTSLRVVASRRSKMALFTKEA